MKDLSERRRDIEKSDFKEWAENQAIEERLQFEEDVLHLGDFGYEDAINGTLNYLCFADCSRIYFLIEKHLRLKLEKRHGTDINIKRLKVMK